MPGPTRIGAIRPSQLMTLAGVGSVVDLPGMSVVVRGLDTWDLGEPITEPRLLHEIQRQLPGETVTALRAPAHDPETTRDPDARLGVPVTPFPRWLRCPVCHEIWPLDGVDQFQLIHQWGRRPDLAKWVHAGCSRQANLSNRRRRACIPARFLVACVNGHLDEFPYLDFAHQSRGSVCAGPRLELRDSGSILGPRVNIRCLTCGSARNISQAAGSRGAINLPRCRGRHPHLQRFEPCTQSLKLLVLGASNLWFGSTINAMHLPAEDPVAQTISANWALLAAQPNADVLAQIVAGMPALRPLAHLSADAIWAALQQERERREAGAEMPEPDGLLDAEWNLLCHPTTTQQDEDFRALPTPAPRGLDRLLTQVVKIDRLREVQALVGFRRIDSADRTDVPPARLTRNALNWVPAVERRGEGIFLELNENEISEWCDRVAHHDEITALRAAYSRWRTNRELPPDPHFPIARYLLVHSLSHLLLRQVALECGYSSASIRERLYVGTPERPTAGLLLSTAASDSEGTLGGLVALADARFLGRLLETALDEATTCSSDPLCCERIPENPSEQLHVAACHACLFAAETSCEAGNRWLHRGVLADLGTGLAFPGE